MLSQPTRTWMQLLKRGDLVAAVEREDAPLLLLVSAGYGCLGEAAKQRVKRGKPLGRDGVDGVVVVLSRHVESHLQ